MTTQQINRARLRALAENATPGPWVPHARYVWTPELGGIIQNWSDDANGAADMDFIAYTRTAVPALLDMLEKAEARIQAVRELHQPCNHDAPCRGDCAECGQHMPCDTIRTLDGI